MDRRTRPELRWRLAWLVVLSAGLAYTEASVVVYLRELLVPTRRKHFPPELLRETVPLLSVEQLRQAEGRVPDFWLLEMAREVTPLAVLVAAAAGLRRWRGEFAGFFLVGFGLWDILYYAFLKLLMDWPASLATWDVLYLIPVPWVAPVWAPLAVAATLLVAGLVQLARPQRRMSAPAKAAAAAVLVAAGGLVLASFVLALPEAIGSIPARFPWPWFLAGWLLGAAGLTWVLGRPLPRRA